MQMGCTDPSKAVDAVRRFNRFYARHAGAIHERLHKSHFSLTDVRILHELAHKRARPLPICRVIWGWTPVISAG